MGEGGWVQGNEKNDTLGKWSKKYHALFGLPLMMIIIIRI
jgi:hypothetical protein